MNKFSSQIAPALRAQGFQRFKQKISSQNSMSKMGVSLKAKKRVISTILAIFKKCFGKQKPAKISISWFENVDI